MSDEPDLLERVVQLRRERRAAALVTVVETRGSTPRKAGARMLIHADGSSEGTIGGGAIEHVIFEAAERVIAGGKPELVPYNLTADLKMCCGGGMTMFVESIVSNPQLIVFGCGHIGDAVIRAAEPLGFEIIGVDDLASNITPELETRVSRVVRTYEIADLEALPFGDDTYVVICTREHAIDRKLVELCVRQPTRYLGAIGSARKAATQKQALLQAGIDESNFARIICPIGIDIGAETPEEIALAICAQLVQARRRGLVGSAEEE